MPAVGVVAGIAKGAIGGALKSIGIPTGGVPLTRYGAYLSQLAQRRGWAIDRADKFGRDQEKLIDDNESKASYIVTGPEGSEVERLWASRVVSAVNQLSPALTPSEWSGFTSTDRAGNAYRRGLIPPRGYAGSSGSPIGFSPVDPSQQGAHLEGGYRLPVQEVTAPNLLWVVLGGAVLLGVVILSRKG